MQNNTSKQEVGLCDKTMVQIVFHCYNSGYPCFIDILRQNLSTPKFSQKYPVVLDKKLISFFLLFLVMAAILAIPSDPILLF